MELERLARVVLDRAFLIHQELGPGLLESAYERILCDLLLRAGVRIQQQVAFPVIFQGRQYDIGFRADIVVENKLILELKSVSLLKPVHRKQLLTYLKISDMRLGLLINFNEELLKDGLVRVINSKPCTYFDKALRER
jgi:GxxExxY protein